MSQAAPMPEMTALHKVAVQWDTTAWMETSGKIANSAGDIVDVDECNEFQREVSGVVEYCHSAFRPCRIIILKPRRRGSSTVSTAVAYRRLNARRATGCIAGGAHYQSQKLFKMVEIYAKNDKTDPNTCEVLDKVARFTNGSELDRITLANPSAGRAGGYQVLIVTEMAFLAEEGVADAAGVISGLVKTVQFVPDSIVIFESTANGASGDFYERWNNAITFEEFKRGKNGYVRIFYAWFQFADLRMPPASEDIYSEDDYSTQEQELADKWNLDIEQVAWMRWAIREECNNDFDKFCEDYPFDPESAFRKSGRNRFDADALDFQETRVKRTKQEFGVLDKNEKTGSVTFRATTEQEASVVRFESPHPGRAYISSCDPATGDSQTSGKDPDSNFQGILRKGYIDDHGYWAEPALVMRTINYKDGVRFGNWWDTHVLEEMIWRMQKYYGGCKVVVEVNKDRGLIELLKARQDMIDIYARRKWNQRTNEETDMLGWETNEKTREAVISNLANALTQSGKGKHGEGIDIRCPWLMAELKNFVVKANGRSEAAKGKHDDAVLGIAIGLYLIDFSTVYQEHVVLRQLPPDLQRIADQMEAQDVPGSYA